MGGVFTKEWSEVVTGSSPGSPDDPQNERVTNNVGGAVAKRRILHVDPRSISDDVTRTPIQVERPNNESTPRASAAPPYLDPRSPSHDMPRTPIAPNPAKNPLSLDDSFETVKQVRAPKPSRGAIAKDLKEIESKIQSIHVTGDANVTEKEEGEITNDFDDDEIETKPSFEKPKPILPNISLMPKKVVSQQLKAIEDSYEKEEGEITHDSDEDENDENVAFQEAAAKPPRGNDKTPKSVRSKSSLESDCRSPLLIENEEPVFEKALSHELAAMAAKNEARLRKPLGSVNNDDSLVI